jgi:tRNA threonylcarbamoyl adenosine modification protein (Sua5/YciO/YrdC/YwlC family)
VSDRALADAVEAASRGELIVFPTDTVYGIGTRPDDPAATQRLFDAKERPRDLTLPVLVPSAAAARAIARFDDRADRLAMALWPGALTLVLPRTPASEPWDLGGDRGSIGVRVPDHPLALGLLAAGALATTSANRSGAAPATTCEELEAVFGERVSVYLCHDKPLTGTSSTVVSLLDGIEVLREGDVEREMIVRLSGG